MVYQSVAWVTYMDIFGFSPIVKENDPVVIHDKLKICYEKINIEIIKLGINFKCYFFSDSLFIVNKTEEDENEKGRSLKQSISATQNALGILYSYDFPARGGLSFGKIAFDDNLIIGQPVLNAVNYEKRIFAPLVFLPCSELEGTSFRRYSLTNENIIMLKGNIPIAGIYIPPFPIEIFQEKLEQNFLKYICYGPDGPAQAWHDAKYFFDKYKSQKVMR